MAEDKTQTKDLLDELLEVDREPAPEPTADDIKALQEQVAALEKEKTGLLADTKKERKKRQQISAQHEKLTQTVSSILEQRNATLNSIKSAVQPEPVVKGLPVTYDEDGEGYVDTSEIQKITAPYAQKINKLEKELEMLNRRKVVESEAQQAINAMVGQKPEYGEAYGKYQTARKWANDKVIEFQKATGHRGVVEPGQALDVIFDSELEAEFNDKFPGIDLDTVVMAETSTRAFNKMLNALSTPQEKALKKLSDDGSKFKKVMNKPSGLGSTTNEGEESIMEKVASLGSADIMALSDKQAEALLEAMLAEEQRDGIKF